MYLYPNLIYFFIMYFLEELWLTKKLDVYSIQKKYIHSLKRY